MTTSELLKKTKDELLTRGWFQGDYVNPQTGEVCIVGAVNAADLGDPLAHCDEEYGQCKAIRIIDRLAVAAGFFDVGSYNDHPGRQPEEVLALMDRAIAIAEQQEASAKLIETTHPAPVPVQA